MKSNRKINSVFLIILGIFFAFSPIIITNLNLRSAECSDGISLDNENLKISAVSGKIHIVNNSGWVDFRNAGNCTGSGTYSDPYIIDNLVIDGKGLGSCIWIENSSVYFKIENCTLYNSGVDWFDAGIKLQLVSNGVLFNNTVNNNDEVGIYLSDSNHNTISENTAINNGFSGIYLFNNHNNNISENTANYNSYSGIELNESYNNTISGNIVNYNYDDGIYFYYSDNNSLLGNNVSYNTNGVYLYSCDGNLIFGNIINNNSIGIYLIESNYNHVVKNSFRDNLMDIVEENCEGNFFGYNINPFEIVIFMILLPIIITTVMIGILKLTKRYVKPQLERGRKDRRYG